MSLIDSNSSGKHFAFLELRLNLTVFRATTQTLKICTKKYPITEHHQIFQSFPRAKKYWWKSSTHRNSRGISMCAYCLGAKKRTPSVLSKIEIDSDCQPGGVSFRQATELDFFISFHVCFRSTWHPCFGEWYARGMYSTYIQQHTVDLLVRDTRDVKIWLKFRENPLTKSVELLNI